MTPRVLAFAIAALFDGERLTKYDLAEKAPCHQRTAQRVLSHIAEQCRVVSVVAWVPFRNQRIPAYGFGLTSKRKPRAMSGAERARRRRRENPEVCIDEMMRKRAIRNKEKLMKGKQA